MPGKHATMGTTGRPFRRRVGKQEPRRRTQAVDLQGALRETAPTV
jgi:hypothetical protein